MPKELKNKIIKHIQDNAGDFQLVNNTINAFRAYIYDVYGDYLIEGEQVANFIKEFLYNN